VWGWGCGGELVEVGVEVNGWGGGGGSGGGGERVGGWEWR
jgi:hypothetical protein